MNNYSTMLNSEILDGIEDIRQNQFIAEMNVMNVMFDYYQKESAFIEHCNFGIDINDLNSGGFITTNDGRCVCIDYGWLTPRGRH